MVFVSGFPTDGAERKESDVIIDSVVGGLASFYEMLVRATILLVHFF